MPPLQPPSVSRVARRSFEATTEDGRAYLQERISLFAKVMFVLLGSYFSFVVLVRFLWGEIVPGHDIIGFIVAATALGGMGGLWLYTRGKLRSARVVAMMDIACVSDPAALLALNAYLMRHIRVAPFAGFVGLSLLVFGRALIVPSTGRRTLAISAIGAAEVLAMTVAIEINNPELMVLPSGLTTALMTMWCTGVCALSSYGSSVIYGLREKVREARQLGQYTLIEKIGEGGMGTVYRARHAMLRRPTAIKLLPPHKAGEQHLARFEREVQHTAELTHPNTVHIYDYGRSPDGIFYYAMELLEGIDLDTLVQQFGAQPPGRVIHILRQVCGALAEAHGRGLVHRDIKPANIFLCHRGGVADVVKVLDFGLVKDLERGGGKATDVNIVAGTPAFLSPEAITSPEEVGPLADIYAVGAVAYYLLAGDHVFGGATLVEVCGHHVHTRPDPLSKRLGRPLDAELEAIVHACLEKKPSARIPGARELSQRLATLAEAHPWTETEAEAWWKDARDRIDDAKSDPSSESDLALGPTIEVDLSARAGAARS